MPKLTKAFARGARARPPVGDPDAEPTTTIFWDDVHKGFGLRVTPPTNRYPEGRKSWIYDYRLHGRQHRYKLGNYPALSLEHALEGVKGVGGFKRMRRMVEVGLDPVAVREEPTFGEALQAYLEKESSKNRTHDKVVRMFDTYVLPRWRDWKVSTIRRSDVEHLLDDIEAGRMEGQRWGSAKMANEVLVRLGTFFKWHEGRDDDFQSPIVKGMRRKEEDANNERVLDDEELRALWHLTEEPTAYNRMVRLVLMTAQRPGTGARVGEVRGMRWDEVGEGTWTIPGSRMKNGRDHTVPLPQVAQDYLAGLPRKGELVCSDDGFSVVRVPSRKATLDRRLAKLLGREVKPWTHHDLRRTARTLMARAKVPDRHAEMVLSHAIKGVEGVYNRHDHEREKREALAAMASLLQRILDDTEAGVVELPRSA